MIGTCAKVPNASCRPAMSSAYCPGRAGARKISSAAKRVWFFSQPRRVWYRTVPSLKREQHGKLMIAVKKIVARAAGRCGYRYGNDAHFIPDWDDRDDIQGRQCI